MISLRRATINFLLLTFSFSFASGLQLCSPCYNHSGLRSAERMYSRLLQTRFLRPVLFMSAGVGPFEAQIQRYSCLFSQLSFPLPCMEDSNSACVSPLRMSNSVTRWHPTIRLVGVRGCELTVSFRWYIGLYSCHSSSIFSASARLPRMYLFLFIF